MYLPEDFKARDRAIALELIRRNPFATVVSANENASYASHLPVTLSRSQPELLLSLHFAKANQHWQHVERAEVLLVFHGPHAYVSPRWYERRDRNVPTWNYAVVHCRGSARLATEPETDDLLHELVAAMEGEAEGAWRFGELDAAYAAAQKRAIVGVRVSVRDVTAKLKLSQNRSEKDRAGVIAGLRRSEREGDRVLADLMAHTSRT